MTSWSMPNQEHRRSPTETATMASGEPQPQLPGLCDPAVGRSDAATMVAGGAAEEKEVMGAKGRSLDDVVLVGRPSGELLLAPTPLMKQDEEVSAPLRPENMRAAAKGKKQCVDCGATETPQWRIHPDPMEQGALCCNACRIGHRRAEALREPVHVHVHLPPSATALAMTIISESPAADGWISEAWMDFDAYLLRREKSPSPTPAPALDLEEKKQKRKRKPWYPRKSPEKQCHHCQSTSTPQWRVGPTGAGTLCNACGVRYRQGRLLEEYRPVASPNFKPSEHACKHREVLQLHKNKKNGMEQHMPPPPPAQAHGGGDELPTGEPIPLDQSLLDAIDGIGDDLQLHMGSLDQFLFDGPAAPPLVVDDDDEDLADD